MEILITPKTGHISKSIHLIKMSLKIKNILSLGAKMTEVYNYSFLGEEKLKKMFAELGVPLQGPPFVRRGAGGVQRHQKIG